MHPFVTEFAAARRDELLTAAVRQRFGWWLMELGLRLATPKRGKGLLEGI
ncbi:hypothetical protein [Amycolatopsis echigonensis]|uniref:Uncharacterized protein n=1 Tax=Amycolatopsis echigonensis TaxID=2576905 RepID=A0A8E1VYG8_9PSEU|nr:hypothetical protein [Amycolatopsis echigonensis]MBB2500724.1 hypothetical protein [Amycolatopsis echigonensis]